MVLANYVVIAGLKKIAPKSGKIIQIMADLNQYVEKKISENPVMVFSKTTCPYCRMAKQVLDKTGVVYKVEEIDGRSDCDQLQDVLGKITGARTVPRVFIGGKCIGGGSDTSDLSDQGKLIPLLKGAGATFKL